MNQEKVLEWLRLSYHFIKDYLPKLAMALVTLIVGLWITSRITKLVKKQMIKREVDASLVPFISSLVNILLKVVVIISVASMVGIATTSFVAVLGAAGLAIGLALQGSLANFAGGVLILLFKPFRVDDVITADGVTGTVKSITIFNTLLTTPDENTAIIPNGVLANNKLINFTSDRNRRIDLEVGVSYDADLEQTIILLYNAMLKVPGVVSTPAPLIGVLSYDDSGVLLAVRPYCKSGDYWDVFFRCNLEIKTTLDAAGIEIPFPQRDLHIKSGKLDS